MLLRETVTIEHISISKDARILLLFQSVLHSRLHLTLQVAQALVVRQIIQTLRIVRYIEKLFVRRPLPKRQLPIGSICA